MKLKQYVKDNPNETLFIGSGVAYFFIGNAEQFDKDIDTINQKYIDGFKKSLYTAKIRLDNLKSQGEPTGEVVKEYWNNFGYLTRKVLPLEKAIADYHKQIDTIEATIDKLTDYLANYVHIKEREVISADKKEGLKDGISVIVEGIEEGRFWLKEEYETGYVEVNFGSDGLGKKKVKVK